MIGQFGVGFYSAFMVADKIEVVSRKAGESEAWRWVSDGKGEFTVEPGERAARGTTIVLHLREDAAEFVEPSRLREIVKTYSDHVALPIVLDHKGKEETLNAASALWIRMNIAVPASDPNEQTDVGRMPSVGSFVVDQQAVSLVGSWIDSVTSCPGPDGGD